MQQFVKSLGLWHIYRYQLPKPDNNKNEGIIGEKRPLTKPSTRSTAMARGLNGGVGMGTAVYAQVDSAHATSSVGAVLESHERRGAAYNNIVAGTAD